MKSIDRRTRSESEEKSEGAAVSDQVVLNLFAAGEYARLPQAFNQPAGSTAADTVICHYVGERKPWAGATANGAVWHDYAISPEDLERVIGRVAPASSRRFRGVLRRQPAFRGGHSCGPDEPRNTKPQARNKFEVRNPNK